jgi:hypothetical protein
VKTVFDVEMQHIVDELKAHADAAHRPDTTIRPSAVVSSSAVSYRLSRDVSPAKNRTSNG